MTSAYVWDLTTVLRVRRLRVRQAVSLSLLALENNNFGRDHMMAHLKTTVAERLKMDAEPYAVDLDTRDIEFREDEDGDFGIMLTARWNPATGQVILLGGPRSGEQLTVEPQMIGNPLHFPKPVYGPVFGGGFGPSDSIAYEYAGWHEALRRWAYRYHEN